MDRENVPVSIDFATRINSIGSMGTASFVLLGAEFIVMRKELYDKLMAASGAKVST